MITPWVFEFFHELRDPAARDDPAAVHDHFRWYQDLWAAAEARGYEGIFFSEHHFGAAYSPAPNLLLPAVAARTSRLRLGVLGSVSAPVAFNRRNQFGTATETPAELVRRDTDVDDHGGGGPGGTACTQPACFCTQPG